MVLQTLTRIFHLVKQITEKENDHVTDIDKPNQLIFF